MSWIQNIHFFLCIAVVVGAKPVQEKISHSLPNFTLEERPSEKLLLTQKYPSENVEHNNDFVLLAQSDVPDTSSKKELFQGIVPKKRIFNFGTNGMNSGQMWGGGHGGGNPHPLGLFINLCILIYTISSTLGLLNVLLPLDFLNKLLNVGHGMTSGDNGNYGMPTMKPSFQDILSSTNYYKNHN